MDYLASDNGSPAMASYVNYKTKFMNRPLSLGAEWVFTVCVIQLHLIERMLHFMAQQVQPPINFTDKLSMQAEGYWGAGLTSYAATGLIKDYYTTGDLKSKAPRGCGGLLNYLTKQHLS